MKEHAYSVLQMNTSMMFMSYFGITATSLWLKYGFDVLFRMS